jgi:hypothetical protein
MWIRCCLHNRLRTLAIGVLKNIRVYALRTLNTVTARIAPVSQAWRTALVLHRQRLRDHVTGAGLNNTSALCSRQCSAQVFWRPLATSSSK